MFGSGRYGVVGTTVLLGYMGTSCYCHVIRGLMIPTDGRSIRKLSLLDNGPRLSKVPLLHSVHGRI